MGEIRFRYRGLEFLYDDEVFKIISKGSVILDGYVKDLYLFHIFS